MGVLHEELWPDGVQGLIFCEARQTLAPAQLLLAHSQADSIDNITPGDVETGMVAGHRSNLGGAAEGVVCEVLEFAVLTPPHIESHSRIIVFLPHPIQLLAVIGEDSVCLTAIRNDDSLIGICLQVDTVVCKVKRKSHFPLPFSHPFTSLS